jgi:uncharacterized iron-regulated protein
MWYYILVGRERRKKDEYSDSRMSLLQDVCKRKNERFLDEQLLWENAVGTALARYLWKALRKIL